MIDNCKLVYVDGVVNVFDNNGSTSSLYAQALEYTNGNQEEAVQIWSATQSEEFDLEVGEENPSLSTVLRFLNNRVSNPKSLSSEELKEVSLLMSDLGITDIDEFTQKMNKLFQPNGYYAVDTKKLMDSGMYSLKDISELDDIQVKTFLEKLNYFNEHKTYKLNSTPNKTKIQLRNTTAKKTPIGSFPLVSEQEFVEYVIDNSVDLTEPNILKTIGESPFSQILDDKKAMKAVMGMFQGRTKVNKMFFDGENFTSENIDTFVTLRNTLLANADPIELESDLEFIESIPQNIWESKQKQIRGVLKEIEQTAIKYNIDVIGISDLATDRASVMEILSALDDVLLAPSLENIKNFATKKDSKISPTKPYTVIELREEYKKYNIVKIDTNLSDDVMFQKGFLRVDSNGLYHRVQRTDVNAMYEVVYQRVLDNNLIIPSEYFAKDLAIKDANNKDAVIEGIKNYINSRDTGIESTLNEEISLFQTIFAHKSLKNSKPQDIETNGEYLKSDFISDFYNYILKEKQAKTDLYNKVLRYFSITDGDITLDALQTPDITGIKYEKELRDYSKLKKDGQIKELSKGESKNQDLAIINNPKKVNEEQGINFVTGNDGYILSEPNPNTYMKVGGKLYRKLFDKANGSLYKAVNLAKNTLYFDNNLNFSYNREEAESAYKNLNKTLQKTPTKSAKELAENVNIPTVLKPIQFSVAPTQNQVAIQRNNGNPLTLAPNGQPSILYQSYKDLGYSDSEAENLTAQVYSDSFLDFFGDWINDPQNASKIVDSEGMPLLTWHNSKSSFNEFKKTKGKRTSLAGIEEVESSGFFFAKEKEFATAYGYVVYPSFLNIRNVFDISQGDGRQQDLYKKVVGRDMMSDMPFGIETAWEYFDGDEFDISNNVIKNNFDGANIYEKSPESSDLYSDVFIAFNSNQIKSATENIGTFSTDNNDIRYQIIGEQGASRMVEYKQQLDRAKQLEIEGKTPAQIELETGWYKYKGDWRTIPKEVVESFQIKDRTVNKELTLKQVLGDDNTIFNFYPEIGGTKVIFLGENYKDTSIEETKKQTFGFVDTEKGIIYINTAVTDSATGDRIIVEEDEQVRTLAHEVNHLIQSIEGFPTGGNLLTVVHKAMDIIGEKELTLVELYDKLVTTDLTKLNENERLIVSATIEALRMYNTTTNTYGFTNQYNHLLGEIDSKIVEEAINFRNKNEAVPSYLQLLNRVTSLRGIALDNIIVVRDGNEGFKLNIEPKTIEKETVDQVINKLKQTGLSSEVFQLNTQQLQEKLKELGVSDDIAMSVMEQVQTSGIINGFYSPLEKIISETKQEKLPVKQWADKFGKGEEAKWTGLADWLSQQEGSITKAEIQNFLKENRIEIKEVTKSQYQKITASDINLTERPFGGWSVLLNSNGNRIDIITKEEASNKQEAKEVAIQRMLPEDTTKYSSYQLEGEKENYKEVLVTLPNKAENRRIDFIDSMLKKYNKTYDLDLLKIMNPSELDMWNKVHIEAKADKLFDSSHYNEGNILVHLRMNTRTDSEGNKILFLEEVQSDWGQQGKKEGFANIEKLPEGYRVDEPTKFSNWTVVEPSGVDGNLQSLTIGMGDTKEIAIQNALKNLNRRKVPTAPFVTDTNAWTKLALKVALKEAVKQGASKIAWTTGEQQNERYDLSKQVNKIDVEAVEDVDNLFFVDINLSNGTTENLEVENGVIREGSYQGQRLDNVVGKDYADKIMSTPKGESKTLEGADLKVGGKGMKGFYGSTTEGSLGIIGNVAKSLFKQTPSTTSIEGNKKLTSEDIEWRGNAYYINGEFVARVKLNRDIESITKDIVDNYNKKANFDAKAQHSIDVTPEMRLQVETQGLPQFNKSLSDKGISVIPNGFIFKDQVFLNTDTMTPDLIFHEFNHLFSNWAKEARPDIYNRGLELARKELKKGSDSEIQDVISYVKQTQPNLTGEALENEVITEFIGRYSKQMMDEQKAKSPLMQWLSDFWASVKEMLGINEMTPAQVANLSLQDYAKASVVTLAKGEKITLEKQQEKAFNEGIEFVQKVADEYRVSKEIEGLQHPKVLSIYPQVSEEIARAYDEAEATNNSEEVEKAYQALEDETIEQYNFIIGKGLKVDKWSGKGEPYTSSKDMLKDLKDNNHLYFLPNDEAFGSEGNKTENRKGLKKTDIFLKDGYQMTLSEVFRVVHDYFGHGILGNQFGAIGEENATLQHLDLYSEKALPAVIFQTRGQNSWVNFSSANKETLAKIKEARQKNDKNLLEESQKMLKFAQPKDNIFPNKYNFKKYETARRIKEQSEIDRAPNQYGSYEISNLLPIISKENVVGGGISSRSTEGNRQVQSHVLKDVKEVELSDEVRNSITKAFPQVKVFPKIYEITDGAVYRDLKIKGLVGVPMSKSVTIYSEEEYSDMRLFITEDGHTGITLRKDGHLGGAFASPKSNRKADLAQLLVIGIKEGATNAEAYHTFLPDYYSAFGFKAVSRVEFNEEIAGKEWDYEEYKRYNNGKPDVVHFIYDGGDRNSIEERLNQFDTYDAYQIGETRFFDKNSYMDSVEYMQNEVIKRNNFEKGIQNTAPKVNFQKVVHDARVAERASVFQLINDFGIVIKNLYPKSQENEIKDKFDECRI